MVGQHRDAAAGREGVQGGGDQSREGVQLAVDLDAQRLEGPFGWVAAAALRRPRHDPAEHVDQGPGRRVRLLRAVGDDGPNDRAGVPLLAEVAQDPLKVGWVVAVEDVGRGHAPGLVHPHVQRRVDPIGEASVGLVQVQRADPEVEQRRVDRRDAQGVDDLGELVIDRVHQGDPVGVGSQPLARQLQGLRVTVDPDQPGAGKGLQDAFCVPAHPERPIDVDRAVGRQRRRQQLQHPVAQDRDMPVRCGALWRGGQDVLRGLVDRGTAAADWLVLVWLWLCCGCWLGGSGRYGPAHRSPSASGWFSNRVGPPRGKSCRDGSGWRPGRRWRQPVRTSRASPLRSARRRPAPCRPSSGSRRPTARSRPG